MKNKEHEEARRLRREGFSVKEICQTLGVAKGSVSVWVRDIELTPEQRQLLKERNPVYRGQYHGAQTNAEKHRAIRQKYQEAGRLKAREKDPLHIAGCMLYWAKGRKNRNRLSLINSDGDLLSFFIKFLRESLIVDDNQIRLRVNCYLGNELTLEEIQEYWLLLLNLPQSCLINSVVNAQPQSSQQKGRKLLCGLWELSVHNTELIQHVFGAIQEYSGIDKPEWLM